MTSKHTPGPWYSSEKTTDSKTVIWAHGKGVTGPNSTNPSKYVAELYDSNDTPANARLIAAAPELLEACKLAINNFIMARKQVGAYNTLNENEKLAYELEQEAFIAMEKAVAKAEDK